jgi:hypothetical protein
MNVRFLAALVPVALIVSAFVGGCSSSSSGGESCTAGEAHACSCAGGETGTQTCGTDGQFGECSCTSGADGGGSDAGASDAANCADGRTGPGCNNGDGSTSGYDGSWEAGGPGTFGAPCQQNSDCQSMDCFNFNSKGPHCTQPCTTASDCPNPPNLGCSGMGQCKVP